MPILTFKCAEGHVTDRIVTFKQEETLDEVVCATCGEMAPRLDFIAPPLPGHFYGNPDGYYKPSPTKRFSTKLVSQQHGNRDSAG